MSSLNWKYIVSSVVAMLSIASCSVYKHVPQGSYLLDKVEVVMTAEKIDSKTNFKSLSYQKPNSKWLGLFRVPLRIYSLSSKKDDLSWGGRLVKNIGQEPVICDSIFCDAAALDMKQALINVGYLKANVTYKIERSKRPKAVVKYLLEPNKIYTVGDIQVIIQDRAIATILRDNVEASLLTEGMSLNANILDDERTRITTMLQRNGYYRFNKDYISFVADTTRNSYISGLRMYIDAFQVSDDGTYLPHPVYTIANVDYLFSQNTSFAPLSLSEFDSVKRNGYSIYFNDDLKLKPEVIESHSFLRTGMLYNTDSISKTYASLARLGLLRYTNIRFDEMPGSDLLNATVTMVSNRRNTLSFQMEGTNTAGDLGAAASMSYSNRNVFHGAELFTFKLRGAYEAITNLPGYSTQSYLEYGADVSIDFPEFLAPFITPVFQHRSQAISQYSIKFNAQKRPEFNKFIFSTAWSYLWTPSRQQTHHLDVIDLNYLVVPWISNQFRIEYLDPINTKNSILKYNYENLFIMRMGYNFYYSGPKSGLSDFFQYSLRMSFETSGNALYGASKLLKAKKNNEGQYEVLNIAFAQYLKHDISFTTRWSNNVKRAFLIHLEYGVAIPYANSTSLPFEKRYFSGGANSVRGWAVRELGPGTFVGGDRKVDYIKQSGDLKLGFSAEFRTNLFWKINGALFVDAGNIWTLRNYEEQPGGLFQIDQFYKEIAVSYGAGIRLDLGFLVFRFDGGMKAINPTYSNYDTHYPFLNPSFNRDFAFHFAVGYPF